MLYEIYCEQFHQKKILFNSGLNVVLGTVTGDNSIGKSTFLLIIDFVFGGKTYSEAEDILSNVGNHDVYFTFIFEGQPYRFCRNNIESHTVYCCDDQYIKIRQMNLDEYCEWLKIMYNLALPELTFRDGVGRYIRVYGKKNCIEHQPLHYIATENAENAENALLKLFDKYSAIQLVYEQAKKSKDAYTTFIKAQSHNYIARINKKQREKNEKSIIELSGQIDKIGAGLEQGILDLDSTMTDQALHIKSLLSLARRAKSRLADSLRKLDENGAYKFSSTTKDFSDLIQFFPDANIAKISEIEEFHRAIACVFKTELQKKQQSIIAEIAEYDEIILEYESQLKNLIQNPNLSRTILSKHSELLKEIERMKRENEAYDQLQVLTKTKKDDAERCATIRNKKLFEVSYLLNDEMSRLNDAIYKGAYNAPTIDFSTNPYHFFTLDNTGTGIAYKGLAVFDLAVLSLTRLPVLVHDSVVLKQISDDAIEQILNLYKKSGKQIIIALDKQTSYSKETEEILNACSVLTLAPGGSELFGRSWG